MFIDLVTVKVAAGKGGNGAVSFRREKFVDKGGPNGGDGGRGGNVVFQASSDLNTLINLRFKPELVAESGANGAKANRNGRSGQDLIVKVPVGTIVKREGELIADLVTVGEQVIIARGGDGGFGNAHFKSSTRQAPKVAELGEPGEAFEAELELKMLADVGLIGKPNAGKSTFLSVVSNARPEIADYEFTTLIPNLGVADVDSSSLLIADIPGLIEGASAGKGLGVQFLRHVERTAVFLHLIDAYDDNAAETYQTIRQELINYNADLAERPEIVVLTKTDGLDDEIIQMQIDKLKTVVDSGAPILAISSKSGRGIKELLRLALKITTEARQAAVEEAEADPDGGLPVIKLTADQQADRWRVRVDGEIFLVSGRKIAKFARRTDFSNYHSRQRLRDIMKKMGIARELVRQGATGASRIRIADSPEVTLEEQSE